MPSDYQTHRFLAECRLYLRALRSNGRPLSDVQALKIRTNLAELQTLLLNLSVPRPHAAGNFDRPLDEPARRSKS
jgi:hypothetical protein